MAIVYNRRVPPLKYEMVYRLVQDFPNLHFSINGGALTYEDVVQHLRHGVVGVMVGRAVVSNPFYWRNVDSILYKSTDPGTVYVYVMNRNSIRNSKFINFVMQRNPSYTCL